MIGLRRVWRVVRLILFVLMVAFAVGWVSLYVDSEWERRKAERLLEDLKAFPFASAGFLEVREVVNRYDGEAEQSFPGLQFLPPGVPVHGISTSSDSDGWMPAINAIPTCTPHDCTFHISITPRLNIYTIPMDYRTANVVAAFLAHIGLRPWKVYAKFEIKDGKLWKSRTYAGQIRYERMGSYAGIVPLDYDVISSSEANDSHRKRYVYAVGVPHATGGVFEILSTRFVQVPGVPTGRAFDLDLHCFTRVWHACAGFSELAPSAWADYQTELHGGGQ
jgi:hypothetical protein